MNLCMKNQISWEDIYLKFSPKMLGICRRYVKSNSIAEDLMHEAFITAIKKIDSFTGKGSLEAWICRISVNISIQYLRENKKTETVLIDRNNSDFPEINNENITVKTNPFS